MPIPDYQTIMLPLLKLASDQKEHTLRESVGLLAAYFKLSEEERNELQPSGQQSLFNNRVAWASTYLRKAGMLESTGRGIFKITKRGMDILKEKPKAITPVLLERFSEFTQFKVKREKLNDLSITNNSNHNLISEGSTLTPEETIDVAYQTIRQSLISELLLKIKECSPEFFERLVIDLLVKMGYGGTRKDAGKAIGRSRDGGIDGIINEDRLGLDVIFIQAKRWEGTVGRPEIQKFVGALQGNKAKKGVFITTSSFTKDAESYTASIQVNIVLIDGEMLANFMIDHNVGVSQVYSYDIKRLDSDYFVTE